MSHAKNVAFVGDSLVIEGVAMSMEHLADIRLIRIDPFAENLRQRLTAAQPDLIVMELRAPWTARILSLLCEWPAVDVAALDFNEQRLVLISSRQYTARTMDELLRRIQTSRSIVGEATSPALSRQKMS
jgi:hypothetical protein